MKKLLLILLCLPLLFNSCKKEEEDISTSSSILGAWNLKEANTLTSYGYYNGTSQVVDYSSTENWTRGSENGLYLNFLTDGTFEGQESDDWHGTADTTNYTSYTKIGNQLILLWDDPDDGPLIFTIQKLTNSTLQISTSLVDDFGNSPVQFERFDADFEYTRTILP